MFPVYIVNLERIVLSKYFLTERLNSDEININNIRSVKFLRARRRDI